MGMWRTSVVTATDHVFPGLVYYDRKKEFYDIENQIQSNLMLQMALYLNVRIYPMWFFVILVNLNEKYYYLTDIYKFVTVTVFIILSILEGIRLYLGYLGNLAEKIPELASFWLISTFIHLPLETFFILGSQTKSHISEIIVNSFMTFLLAVEIITAMVALQKLANHYAMRFYIAHLYGIHDEH